MQLFATKKSAIATTSNANVTPKASETLAEIQCVGGKKVIVEAARRDALGRTIDTTYATKSELPTSLSQLTNDSGFITASALEGYTAQGPITKYTSYFGIPNPTVGSPSMIYVNGEIYVLVDL